MSQQQEAKWLKLSDKPFKHLVHSLEAINNDEYLLIADDLECGLYTYSISKDTYTEMQITPPTDKQTHRLGDIASCYDSKNNIIYYHSHQGQGKEAIYVVDVALRKMNKKQVYDEYSDDHYIAGNTPVMFVLNGKLYLFDRVYGEYIYFATNDNPFANDMDPFHIADRNLANQAVFVSSSQRLLLFTLHGMSAYSMGSNHQWYRDRFVQIPWFIHRNVSIVLDSQQEFVFFVNVTDVVEEEDDEVDDNLNSIVVYNLVFDKRYFSSITCPKQSLFAAIIFRDQHRDELLVFGYVRALYRRAEFIKMRMIPRYLIQLIGSWVCNEFLHLMEREQSSSQHWKIHLDEIMGSLKECDQDGAWV